MDSFTHDASLTIFVQDCCGSQQTHCAECRGHIESQITCHSLQNLVEHMVDISTKTNYGIIEKDDLDQHHKRKRAAEADGDEMDQS